MIRGWFIVLLVGYCSLARADSASFGSRLIMPDSATVLRTLRLTNQSILFAHHQVAHTIVPAVSRTEQFKNRRAEEDDEEPVETERAVSGQKRYGSFRLYDVKKSPWLAVGLSMVVGFGSGNFYANQRPAGYLMMVLDMIALGVTGAGIATTLMEGNVKLFDSRITAGEGILFGGATALFIERFIAMIFSVQGVMDYNEILDRTSSHSPWSLGITSIAGSGPHSPKLFFSYRF